MLIFIEKNKLYYQKKKCKNQKGKKNCAKALKGSRKMKSFFNAKKGLMFKGVNNCIYRNMKTKIVF